MWPRIVRPTYSRCPIFTRLFRGNQECGIWGQMPHSCILEQSHKNGAAQVSIINGAQHKGMFVLPQDKHARQTCPCPVCWGLYILIPSIRRKIWQNPLHKPLTSCACKSRKSPQSVAVSKFYFTSFCKIKKLFVC